MRVGGGKVQSSLLSPGGSLESAQRIRETSLNLKPPLEPSVLESAVAAYRVSRLLFSALELDIAGHLAAGPLDAAELARATATHQDSLRAFLDALAAFGVLSRDEREHYSLTDFGRRMVAGAEGSANRALLLGWIGSASLYEAFGGLTQMLRRGRSAFEAVHGTGFYGYLARHSEEGRRYEQAMEATAEEFAACAAAVDFGDAKLIVDVGGGRGALLHEILRRHPGPRAICFDTPDTVASAGERTPPESAGRIAYVGGDALSSVPAGGDIYLTSTVLRCFSDDACGRLLSNIRAAIASDGKLLCFELVLPPQRDDPARALADLTARVVYGGRDRTEAEYRALLRTGGFELQRIVATGGFSVGLEAVPC
jgi:hypothetical protein